MVDLGKIRHNTGVITRLLHPRGISTAGVVKAVCGMPGVAGAMLAGGAAMLADSRLENLEKLASFPCPRLLLRLPMASQAEEVVLHSEISLNSEIETLKALGRAAGRHKKPHGVLLMLELGDLREGLALERGPSTVEEILKIPELRFLGIGANFTCYGGILPDSENLGALAAMARTLTKKFNLELPWVSGGNSSSLYLLKMGGLPREINHLRLGEALLLGRETALGQPVEGAWQDAFTLLAEVVELQDKPSLPWGERGLDAFGNRPVFQDRGMRKRAILAIGRQDVHPENLTPLDPMAVILGASSDHLLLDVTETKAVRGVGDTLAFRPNYGGLLQLMTSPYVQKESFDKGGDADARQLDAPVP